MLVRNILGVKQYSSSCHISWEELEKILRGWPPFMSNILLELARQIVGERKGGVEYVDVRFEFYIVNDRSNI